MKAKKKTKTQIKEEFTLATANAVLQFARLQKIKTAESKPTISEAVYYIHTASGRYEEVTEMLSRFINEAEAFLQKHQPVEE